MLAIIIANCRKPAPWLGAAVERTCTYTVIGHNLVPFSSFLLQSEWNFRIIVLSFLGLNALTGSWHQRLRLSAAWVHSDRIPCEWDCQPPETEAAQGGPIFLAALRDCDLSQSHLRNWLQRQALNTALPSASGLPCFTPALTGCPWRRVSQLPLLLSQLLAACTYPNAHGHTQHWGQCCPTSPC